MWHLATVMLNIPGCCYFDDYPHYEIDKLCHSSQQAYETLLRLLGWKFAEGEKNLPFATSYNILGATVDLSSHNRGIVQVSNKPGRLEHIAELAASLKESMSQPDLSVLRGHIVFASGFCLGRALRPAMGSIDVAFRIASNLRAKNVAAACDDLIHLVSQAGPRSVECAPGGPPMLVFTDSAFEKGAATVGALILDPELGKALVYDGDVPKPIIAKWQSSGGKQIISQSELATVVLARVETKALLKNRRVIFFIDNEAARFALIKGVSGKSSMQVLTSIFHETDLVCPCFHWIERVPSPSNPSDLPTRGKTRELVALTGATYAGRLEFPNDIWEKIMSTKEEPLQFFEPLGNLLLDL